MSMLSKYVLTLFLNIMIGSPEVLFNIIGNPLLITVTVIYSPKDSSDDIDVSLILELRDSFMKVLF